MNHLSKRVARVFYDVGDRAGRRWVRVVFLALFVSLLAGCNDTGTQNSSGKGASTNPPPAKKELTPEELRKKGEEAMRKAELEEMAKIPTFEHGDTLEGTDANGDGIRDDIEKYIDGLDISETKKRGMKALAKVYRELMLTDLNDEAKARKIIAKMSLVIDCYSQSFEGSEEGYKYLQILQGALANTKSRTEKYIEFNLKASGGVYHLTKGDACEDFK